MARILNGPPRLMRGATSGVAGASGYVPQPSAGDESKLLNGAGLWVGASPLTTKVSMPATTATEGAAGQYAIDGDELAVYSAGIGWLFFTGYQK